MWEYIGKVSVTVAVVIAVAEIGKRSSLWGAVLASLPLTSLLAFVWLYVDTGSTETVANLSRDIFWLVLASLPLFLVLPALLRAGVSFWPSLGAACVAMVAAYFGLVWLLGRVGVRL
ncbi:MAG: DUF3147 family protein [Gammaproteobacteria bacterium]